MRNVSTSWQQVSLSNSYTDAIPVCTYNLATFAGANPAYTNPPAVPRIRNITANSFELRVQGWEDGAATTGNVHCIVSQSGAFTLPDGRVYEARSVLSDQTSGQYSDDGGWNQALLENVTTLVSQSYTKPVVLGQVISYNDSRASVFYTSDCDNRQNRPYQSGMADGICVGKHIGMIRGARLSETIGFIVAEAGSGTVNNVFYELDQGSDSVAGNNAGNTGDTYPLNRDHNIGVLSQVGEDGGNGSWAVLYGVDPLPSNQMGLAVDEEIFAGDTTRNHTNEPVDYWVFAAAEVTLQKQIINDDGGGAVVEDFTLSAVGPDTIVGVSGDLSVTNAPVHPGTYTLGETTLAGYSASSWSCSGGTLVGNELTLVGGDNVVCQIVNDDLPTALLTIEKEVVNDDGGDAMDSDFSLSFTDGVVSGTGVEGDAAITSVRVPIGVYKLTESSIDGYNFEGIKCSGADSDGSDGVMLDKGEIVTCTFINNDIAPQLTVQKKVSNDNGGTLGAADFDLTINGTAASPGVAQVVTANSPVTIAELDLPGYSEGSWSCSDSNGLSSGLPGSGTATGTTFSLLPGSDVVCDIVNDDIAPKLTLLKTVTNDDGGDKEAADFDLTIDGLSASAVIAQDVIANTDIRIRELDLPGYTEGVWLCTDAAGISTSLPSAGLATDTIVNLPPGADVSCEITNNDIAPLLRLNKKLINDDGGNLAVTDFDLAIDGTEVPVVVKQMVMANTPIVISELDLDGYSEGSWNCSDDNNITTGLPGAGSATGTSITLLPGSDVICTIVNDDSQATLTLAKKIINDNGGDLAADDFDISIDGIEVASGLAQPVVANTGIVISELDIDGYTEGTWSCRDATGLTSGLPTAGAATATKLSVAAGADVTCEITNDDTAPTLSLSKIVSNDDGGNLAVGDFDISIGGIEVANGVALDVTANTAIIISEVSQAGYTQGVWSCSDSTGLTSGLPAAGVAGGETLLLKPGSVVSCEITNDDIAPTIALTKIITNDDGGSKSIADFTLQIDGVAATSGVAQQVAANIPIVISEVTVAGYAPGSWSCSDSSGLTAGLPAAGAAGGETIILNPGSTVACEITNDDIAPLLTLVKSVINDDGGDLSIADFDILIDGAQVTSGVAQSVTANAGITISELPHAGYASGSWVCTDNNLLTSGLTAAGSAAGETITLVAGSDVVCQISNDDIAPVLSLNKTVTNDDGGTLAIDDFDISIDGAEVIAGVAQAVSANTDIIISELELPGYTQGSWSCSDSTGQSSGLPSTGLASGETINLKPGSVVNCEISNDDIAPTLRLNKTLLNDDGGDLTIADFNLSIDGSAVSAGIAQTVLANSSINISEIDDPGYSAGSWLCTDAVGLAGGLPTAGAATGTAVVLPVGAVVTCEIANDDIAPTLTLVKNITNDDGGTETVDNFDLSINGVEVPAGVAQTVAANMPVTISEIDHAGYTEGNWLCTDATGLTDGLPTAGVATGEIITLKQGAQVSCEIVNNDNAPTLTLLKTVINDDGGNLTAADFKLSIDGVEVVPAAVNTVVANTAITISETDLPGYSEGSWLCTDANAISSGLPVAGDAAGSVITLAEGAAVSCEIINNDIAPRLKLIKNIVNDNGGVGSIADFELSVDGAPAISGVAQDVMANTPLTISEQNLPGYVEGEWSCTDANNLTVALPAAGAASGESVTLATGADVSCDITNDDIAPTLTLVKTLSNDDGGALSIADFDLTIDGVIVGSGTANTVDANTAITIGETDLPGYIEGSWSCVDATGLSGGLPVAGAATGSSLTLDSGAEVTCEISNDDIAPTLTLTKSLTNDDGGNKAVSDFDLSIDGTEVPAGAAQAVAANTPIIISELNLDGYATGSWSCSDANGLTGGLPTAGLATGTTITLLPGSAVNCEIINDDQAPTLTLVKNLINDNGGNLGVADFDLSIDGTVVSSGSVQTVVANTPLTISEATTAGYTQGSWSCTDANGLSSGLPTAGAPGATTVTLAEGAAVTCEIGNDDIAPTLTLIKTLVNDNGGLKTIADFDIAIGGTEVTSGAATVVAANTPLVISELALPGYTQGQWSCTDANGLTTGLPTAGAASGENITLQPGSDVSCEISNNDIAPTLSLVEIIINDDGGTLTGADFDPSIEGLEVLSGAVQAVAANTVIGLGELDLPGYAEGSWSCVDANNLTTGLITAGPASGDTVTLVPGSAVTCTITNNDIAPTLALTKTVVNDDGGNLGVADFDISIDGTEVANGVAQTVVANTAITISELSVAGYTPGNWVCSDAQGYSSGLPTAGPSTGSSVTLAPGAEVSCAIVNNDIAPQLTLVKTVVNDNGGNKTAADFDPSIDGTEVVSGVSNSVTANTAIVISEIDLAGYTEGSWSCSDANALSSALPVSGNATGETITLASGADVSCEISNNDEPSTLTLSKTIINDHGGALGVADFDLSIDGTEVPAGVAQSVTANTPITISELVHPGYTQGSWSCSDANGQTTGLPVSGTASGEIITLQPGSAVSCEISNDDNAPTLTLNKTPINDDGGDSMAADFDLSIDGNVVVPGVANTVAANTPITISEIDHGGYSEGSWSCVDANGLTVGLPVSGSASGESITLAEGADVSCEITNDDIAPTLSLVKTLVNDNGGSLTIADFDLLINGTEVTSGAVQAVQANTSITISELDVAGYAQGSWDCRDANGQTVGLPVSGDAQNTVISLKPGAAVVCEITNDDIPPTLALNKTVVNDDGGNLGVTDFDISIDGIEVASGVVQTVAANSAIVISELNVAGYTSGNWLCSDAQGLTSGLPTSGDATGTSVTLSPGAEVSCAIVNNDIAPQLTLVKTVVNDNGGNKTAADFDPSIDGAEVVSGVSNTVAANTAIVISEADLAGYAEGSWSCIDANALSSGLPVKGVATGETITLAPGADVRCEISNNDDGSTLTLNKTIINDHGGELGVADFDLSIDGTEVPAGVAQSVTANTPITISELVHPGYTQGSWNCVDAHGQTTGLPVSGTASGVSITLQPGSAVSCVISNDDTAPKLTLNKTLINDHGGSLTIDDFDVSIDGIEVVVGVAQTVSANTPIIISELAISGYSAGTWSCSDANTITSGLPAAGSAGGETVMLLPGSDVSCSISNDDIAPTLTLTKTLINDNGGSLTVADFDISIDGIEVISGNAATVAANTAITISELLFPGYTAGVWSCSDANALTPGLPTKGVASATSLTLAEGADVTCTITNDDIAPTLTLVKSVSNDDGGTLSATDFDLQIDGNSVTSGAVITVSANSNITISEPDVAGYLQGTWLCTDANSLTTGLPIAGSASGTIVNLAPASAVSCSIANNDIAPTLTLTKNIINDNGGLLAATDFDPSVDGVEVVSGVASTVAANVSIDISEIDHPGYSEGSWACTDAHGLTSGLPSAGAPGATALTLAAGSAVTCEITNNDIAPLLTLTKTLVNDNGGALSIDDFDLAIDGVEVLSGVAQTVAANTALTISELDMAGYTQGSWVCTDANSVTTGLPSAGLFSGVSLTLAPGADVSCAITNDDMAPTLTLNKIIVNDNGGDSIANDFDLSIDGVEVTAGVANIVAANTPIIISEIDHGGYTEGSWSCVDANGLSTGLPSAGAATGVSLTLVEGSEVSCEINNNDIAPTLSLVKTLINNNGGNLAVADFDISIDGSEVSSGAIQPVLANSPITISELDVAGYAEGNWSCIDGNGQTTGLPVSGDAQGTVISLKQGAAVVCSITNDDLPPTLTLTKTVVNDDGGSLAVTDFDLSIDSAVVASGVAQSVTANSAITISELIVAGYTPGNWLCSDAQGLTSGLPAAGAPAATVVTLVPGAEVNCEIENNDIAPQLTLVKTVINNNGGNKSAADFDPSIDGVEVVSGDSHQVTANAAIVISETMLAGYTQGSWSCTDGNSLSSGLPLSGAATGETITLAPGSDVTCEISNDDDASTLTLNKTIINDDGGALGVDDFDLSINGTEVAGGVAQSVSANTPITISELVHPGYTQGSWSCSDANSQTTGLPVTGLASGEVITLQPGSAVTCEISNDDIAPKLTLLKTLVNNNGGDSTVADFDLSIDGTVVLAGVANPVVANTPITISEIDHGGYSEGSWNCSDANSQTTGLPAAGSASGAIITLAEGADVSCEITNNDIAPTLSLVKTLLNDNGGSLTIVDFELSIDGAVVTSGAVQTVAANTPITIAELDVAGYAEGSWNCSDTNGQTPGLPASGDAQNTVISLKQGSSVVCEITNNDLAPTLTLIKTVVNDDGGNLGVEDFDISIDGAEVVNGVATTVVANSTITISELIVAGYTTGSWLCTDAQGLASGLPAAGDAAGTNVTLSPGAVVSCAIENNDIAPKLTLVKTVVNDNGGNKTVADFDLLIDGTEVVSGVSTPVAANTVINISEPLVAGYGPGSWSCADANLQTASLPAAGLATGEDITLAVGADVTCEIANDDVAPTLKLVKTLINDNGGAKTIADFELSVNGSVVPNDVAQAVSANEPLTVSELNLDGYIEGNWLCTDNYGLSSSGDAAGHSITLAPGAVAECAITNNDQPPLLTLVKNIINDDGGDLTAVDFDLSINDVEITAGLANVVSANTPIKISELALPGYTEGSWACVDANGFSSGLPTAGSAVNTSVTLAEGADVTCEIDNDDIAPTLTLSKTLINDDGGARIVEDFDIAIDGTEVVSGAMQTVVANTDIVISELNLAGYAAGSWACTDANGLTPSLPVAGGATETTLNLAPGSAVSCDITNDDITATLTLNKNVVNDNGGDLSVADFELSIDGTVVTSGLVQGVTANIPLTIAEAALPGYTAGSWSCVDQNGLASGLPDGLLAGTTATVTLAEGSAVICEISNDDIAPVLSLVKLVSNDNGGTKTVADFEISIDGTQVSGPQVVMANTDIIISELDLPGYSEGSWSCTDANAITTGLPNAGVATGETISLKPGAAVSCEISNDDIAPTLTLVENIINDDGGTLSAVDFDPSVNGLEVLSGAVQTVAANTAIALSEIDLPGYTEGVWSCVDANNLTGGLLTAGVATGDSVTLQPGSAVVCTIINNDIAPKLTLVKTVTNDNGGDLTAADFDLSIDGTEVVSGTVQTVLANTVLNISELEVAGYTAGSWSCSDTSGLQSNLPTAGVAGATSVMLVPGADVTCAIENNDLAPKLTLIKTVNNDNNGDKTPADFDPSINGTEVISGVSNLVAANTPLIISELDLLPYAEGSWSCTDANSLTTGLPAAGPATATSITLNPGSDVSCEITNNDLGIDLSIAKNVDDAAPDVGQTIVFDIIVTNSGPDDASNVTVSDVVPAGFGYVAGSISGADSSNDADPVGAGLGWTIDNMTPGTPVTLSFSAIVNATPMSASVMTNTASVIASSDQYESSTANNSASVAVLPKALELTKTADVSALSAPVVAGDVISYTITATNTGLLGLNNIVLTDTIIDAANLPQQSGDLNNNQILDAAEVWVWQGGYTVSQADIDSNGGGDADIDNTVTLATDELPPLTGSATVPVTQVPSFSVDKSVDTPVVAAPTNVNYTITVSNTGNQTLSNVTLVDTLPDGSVAALSGPTNDIGIAGGLDVGESWVYSTSYAISQSQIDNGTVLSNTVSVTTDETGNTVQTASAETTINSVPEFAVNKVVDKPSIAAPGVLTYTITVENTGNMTLTGLAVDDTLPDGLNAALSGPTSDSGISGALDVGEIWTYNTSYSVSQTDIDNGAALVNTVSVVADQTGAQPQVSTAQTTVSSTPSFTVAKTVDQSAVAAPATLNYTISVENTGNVSLSNVNPIDLLPDGSGAVLTGPVSDSGLAGVLDIGEVWQYNASYAVTQADIDSAIDMTNRVDVTTDQTGTTVESATAVTSVSVAADLLVSKTVDTASMAAPGTVNYVIEITNTGNVSLENVNPVDTLPDGTTAVLSGPLADTGHSGVLDVAEVWQYTTSYNITQADIDVGLPRTNTVVVTTDQTADATFSATAVTTIDSQPSYTLSKTADQTTLSSPGVINYTIAVSNTGNVSLTDVVISDTMPDGTSGVLAGPAGDGGTPQTIDVGEVWTYTAQYPVNQAMLDSGVELINLVQVETTQAGVATDTAHTIVSQAPELSIVKTAVETDFEAIGDVINYDLIVKNTGNLILDNVVVTDQLADAGSLACDIAMPFDLAPAEMVSCTATRTVATAQIAATSIDNLAAATSTDPAGNVIDAQSDVVTVAMLRLPPVANDDLLVSPVSAVPVTLSALANDTDENGDLLKSSLSLLHSSATDSDGDGDFDTLQVAGEGSWQVDNVTGEVTFTPVAGFTADPTPLAYTIGDATGLVSNQGLLTINYPQTAPVAKDDTAVNPSIPAPANPTSLNVVANNGAGIDTDPENDLDVTTIHLTDSGATDTDGDGDADALTVAGEGVWSVANTAVVTFTPEAGFVADPTPVSYTIKDHTGLESNAAVITIDYPQTAPTAVDDEKLDQPLGQPVVLAVLANDTDPENNLDPASVVLINPASGVEVTLVIVTGEGVWQVDPLSGEITFTPEDGFHGDPTPIRYRVSDTTGVVSNAATVTVTFEEPAVIAGTVWLDSDRNGQIDADEQRKPGWTLKIINSDGVEVATIVTDSNGEYQVSGLIPGVFTVEFYNEALVFIDSSTTGVAVLAGQMVNLPLPVDPSGIVYDSISRLPIAGVTLNLVNAGNMLVDPSCLGGNQQSQITQADGLYAFDVLPGAHETCGLVETYRIELASVPETYHPNFSTIIRQQGAASCGSPEIGCALSAVFDSDSSENNCTFDAIANTNACEIQPQADVPTSIDDTRYYVEFEIASGDRNVIFNHLPIDARANDAQLLLSKSSNKKRVSIGGQVQYVISAENMKDVPAFSIDIVDQPPAGFIFNAQSARLIRAGADGEFDTADDDVSPLSAVAGDPIQFAEVDFAALETLRIQYVMNVGTGVVNGSYRNTASATGPTGIVASTVSASVEVIPDPVLQQATLIGKVFVDRDEDGNQDPADASGLVLRHEYFGPNGLALPDLPGRLGTGDNPQHYAITVNLPADIDQSFSVTSAQGSRIAVGADGRITERHRGALANGLNAQNLRVCTVPTSGAARLADGSVDSIESDVVRVTITNHGIVEQGIPGVRLATVQGLLVETDAYGRFNIPDVDTGRSGIGSNFALKVDPATLPENARFTTENPQIVRMVSDSLNRINFGVVVAEEDPYAASKYRCAGEAPAVYKTVEVKLGSVFFDTGSHRVRDDQRGIIFDIGRKLREFGGGHIYVKGNTDSRGDYQSNIELAERRARAVHDILLRSLGHEVMRSVKVTVDPAAYGESK